MPERQEIKHDFDLWWEDAGRVLASQVMMNETGDRLVKSRGLLLIAYTQGRLDECARITRQFQERVG